MTTQPHVIDIAAYIAPSPEGISYRLLDVAEVQPPKEVAEVLGLPEGGTAVLRKRVALLAGEPIELDWSYYPVELSRGTDLARNRLIKGGAPRVLAEAGFPERDFADEVFARPATAEEAELFDLSDDAPVMAQFRVVYSDNERPVEVSLLAKPGQRVRLRYRQTVVR